MPGIAAWIVQFTLCDVLAGMQQETGASPAVVLL